ncbi:hypothetical protein Syun_031972 [Stephania yunnanensis]|uniref:Uncharacterized protein n=1 Tax=Stephania yunnanensis TaxID=152371 RepID=A0AAP0E015_9MAGN
MPGGISNPGFSAMVSRQDSELSITHVYTCEPTNRQIEPVDTALLNYFDGLERLNPDPGDSHELLLNKASRLIEHYLEFFYLSLPESHTSLDLSSFKLMPYKLTSGGVLSASSLASCAALKRFPKGLVGLGEWFYRIPRHSLRYFKSLAEMPNNSLLTWARE